MLFTFVAHHTDAMVTASSQTVIFTAIGTQIAVFADRTAVGADLIALHAHIRTVFAGIAAFTQNHAVGAIFLTILAQSRAFIATPAFNAQVGAVFTDTAIRAKGTAFTAKGAAAVTDGYTIGAVFFASAAQRYTVFTVTAIQTHLCAVFTCAAIGAEHAAFAAGAFAFRTNRDALNTVKFATAAEIHTVFTPSAVIAEHRTVFTGAALCADSTALTAGVAAVGADIGTGCTRIAVLAEILRLFQAILTSGAVLVFADRTFNAHFAVFADIASGTIGTQTAFRTVYGIIVYVTGIAIRAGCAIFPMA